MDEIAATNAGKQDNDDGNYLRALGIDAANAGVSAIIRLATDHKKEFDEINKKYKNNPAGAEKAKTDATTEFFLKDKRYGDGHLSIS